LKPNGHAPRKQAQEALIEPCTHPKKARWVDVENGELVCCGDLGGCGEVLRIIPERDTSAKFGRSPQNFAVFHNNLGSTTKAAEKHGTEPIHQLVVASVRGSVKYNRRPLELITKTCPKCLLENHLRVFEDVFCEDANCGVYLVTCKHCKAQNIMKDLKELGKCVSCRRKLSNSKKFVEFVRTRLAEQVTRWLPVDPMKYGNNTSAVGYMSDLRTISQWDPQEDSFAFKKAKELFSQRFDGELSDEDASRLAGRYMKMVKTVVSEQKKSLPKVLESLLDSLVTFEGVNA